VVHGGELLDASVGTDVAHAFDDIGDERCVRVVDVGARCQARFDLGDKRPATRARRVAKYLDMLRRGERIHG
jgi:hypothetical protein